MSRVNPAEGMGNCFHLRCQAVGQDCYRLQVMGGSCTLLDSEAPPWLVFHDWAISVHCKVLWQFSWMRSSCVFFFCVVVFFNSILSASHSTVLSKFFVGTSVSQRCQNPVWAPFLLLGLLKPSAGILAGLVMFSRSWPIQDLPHSSLHPFASSMASWRGL